MPLAGWLTAFAVGLLAGGLAGLIGVGGGVILVPFLYFFLTHPELGGVFVQAGDQAVVAHATSLIAIVFISIRGYAIAGVQAAGDLSGLATYLHLPAAAGLTAGALVAVPIGSRLQSRLSPRALRRLFAVVFFLLGARLVIVNLIHIAGV